MSSRFLEDLLTSFQHLTSTTWDGSLPWMKELEKPQQLGDDEFIWFFNLGLLYLILQSFLRSVAHAVLYRVSVPVVRTFIFFLNWVHRFAIT